MKKTLLLIGLLFCLLQLSAHLIETGSLEGFLFGVEENCQYDNWVSHIAEGVAIPNYNNYAPYDRQLNGFGDYRTPSTTELNRWGGIIDLFLQGNLDAAQASIDTYEFPYQALQFNDTDSGKTFYMLREIPNWDYYDDNGTIELDDDEHGAFDYGWGIYIFCPEDARPVIVNMPHPNDDYMTPAVGFDAFMACDASFYMVAGAGREVKWTNVGNYQNAKSISDPSRNNNHPFTVAYKKFCDYVRQEFNHRELSLQVHAYDYDLHIGYANCQLSAGNGRDCINLPTRDQSSFRNDLIHRAGHLVHPANSIGIHTDVYLNDFYAVNNRYFPVNFDDGEHQYLVNDHIDLPGYNQNVQMVYSVNGMNDYDQFDPFFHIEMDELPNCYEQNVTNYKWFHGWDENTGTWDYANRFTIPRLFYNVWVRDMAALMDDIFEMDDELVPPTPQMLGVVNSSMYHVTLSWERSDGFDFDSYEILYATSPIDLEAENYTIYDRDSKAILASQECERVDVTSLQSGRSYYFRIRARDKNGNYSDLSNEVTSIPAPANITAFTAHGMGESNRLFWGVGAGYNFQGFKLFRKEDSGEYVLIDNYVDNPLLASGSYNYEYWDMDLTNGTKYTYYISMVDNQGVEHVHNHPTPAVPQVMHDLKIENLGAGLSDTAQFSHNPYATDAKDDYWDTTKSNPSGNYVWVSFWEQYWGNSGTHCQRNVREGFDVNNEIKSWIVRVRSSQTGVPLHLSVPTAFRGEKIFIYDNGTGNWHNVGQSPYEFTVSNTNARTMTLYWGDLQPITQFTYMNNQVLQGGSNLAINWSHQMPFLLDYANLYVKSSTDSLMLYENIPVETTNYSWQVPTSLSMDRAKFYIEAVGVDGVSNIYESSYTHTIVPYTNVYMPPVGWNAIANPFTSQSWSVSSVLGDESLAYLYDDGFEEADTIPFGAGRFVFASDPTEQVISGRIQKNQYDVNLEPGWNLVANPHLCGYDLSSLQFVIDNNAFKFSQLLSYKLVSRAIFVYRDNQWQATEYIEPYESFFIKSLVNDGRTVKLRFHPNYDAPEVSLPNPFWSIKASVNFGEKDSIILGAHPMASMRYNFFLDLPKPPAHELFTNARLFIDKRDALGYDEQELYSKFYTKFPVGESDMVFEIALQISEAGEYEFEFEKDIPEGWTAFISFEGQIERAIRDLPITFSFDEAGEHLGQIIVYNYPVSNEDLVIPPVALLKAYPNPFNPDVNISFSLSEPMDCTVKIYNLKGQRVANLHKGVMAAGNHILNWNGKDSSGRSVASGVYFARVETPKQAKSIKMILMK